MILRLSQKLNKKLKAGKLSSMPLDENPYTDWSCHLFTADRVQYIIMSNTKSLYSCVMHGKGITDASRFTARALSTIREFMEDDGQEFFEEEEDEAQDYEKALHGDAEGTIRRGIASGCRFGGAYSNSVCGSLHAYLQ